MIKQQIKLTNKYGLHARAAAKLVDTANKFTSEIQIHTSKRHSDAKSIMGMLTLGAGRGSMIEIWAQGKDSRKAINTIVTLIEHDFHEPDEE